MSLTDTPSVASFTIADTTYHLCAPEDWTLRQYEDASELLLDLLPFLAPLVNSERRIDVSEILRSAGTFIPLIRERRALAKVVAIAYVAEGASYDDEYPRDEHMKRLSGAKGSLIIGAVKSFLPYLGSLIPGVSPTSTPEEETAEPPTAPTPTERG